ncbi:uncharacterized protein M6B38_207885 [Iris pallida]|uniref:Uncharacterized protein n=1 Tax=Iris pallida TaxID=29817 RepID=A0AAX6E5Y8_IRIPA|nr:uncharacterized protein M6B38_207885 [Iris pallida]
MKTLISLPPLFPSKALRKPAKISARARSSDDGIPADEVRVLAKFKSPPQRHPRARGLPPCGPPVRGVPPPPPRRPGEHPQHLLPPPDPHLHLLRRLRLPPLLPPGPVGVLGFGAGSAARLLSTSTRTARSTAGSSTRRSYPSPGSTSA